MCISCRPHVGRLLSRIPLHKVCSNPISDMQCVDSLTIHPLQCIELFVQQNTPDCVTRVCARAHQYEITSTHAISASRHLCPGAMGNNLDKVRFFGAAGWLIIASIYVTTHGCIL